MHMPNSEGQEDPCNPIVKSVRVKEACSGVPIRNGVAENSTIVRVDIFKRKVNIILFQSILGISHYQIEHVKVKIKVIG